MIAARARYGLTSPPGTRFSSRSDVAVADHPQGAGAVVVAPGDRRRGEAAGREPLVGVHVGGQEQGQLAQAGQLPGQELLHQLRVAVVAPVAGHDRVVAVGAAEAEVDVAGVALALVVLGHEGQAAAVLGGDLLGPVLVDDVAVGGGQGVGVAEGDLVLAVVALALGRLDPHAGPGHGVADAAQQRLDPGRAQQRVVDVVVVGRAQVAVGLGPGLLVAVAEHDELELGAGVGRPAPLGQPLQLPPQHPPGRGQHRAAVLPGRGRT